VETFTTYATTHLGEESHKVCGMVGNFPGGGVKNFSAGALVEVEAGGAGCDVQFLALQCRHIQVEEVTWED